jgi:hypothetical protein
MVDNTFNEMPGLIVLNNSLVANHGIAGLDDNQTLGATVDVINRSSTYGFTLAAEDTTAAAKDRFTTAMFLPAGGKARLYYNGTRWEPYSDNAAGLITKAVLFTENATNTIHTGTVVVPAGAILHDIEIINYILWTATSASLKVGDSVDDDGYFAAVNLKATDLVVGEVLRLSDSGAWGSEEGVYLTSAGRRGAVATNFGTYMAAGTSIIGVITVGTPATTVGRTIMRVSYSVPVLTAAVATGP